MNLIKKTAMASAIAASVGVAAPAFAVDYDVSLGTDTVVLAQEIFGVVAAESNGQADLTLVTLPNVDVDLDDDSAIGAGAGDGDIFPDAGTSTVQLILGGNAQWGEDISSTQLAACANGGAGALSGNVFNITDAAAGALVPATACDGTDNSGATADEMLFEVIQGGAPTDNTITIRFTANDGADELSLDDFTFRGVAARNLVDQLSQGSAQRVLFSSEYNEADETGGTADDTDPSENDAPVRIFASAPSLNLSASPLALGALPRISVASDQKLFTNEIPGLTDFDPSNDVDHIVMGTLQADITTISSGLIDSSGPGTVVGTDIKGEDGNDFEYAGGDTHEMTLSGGFFRAFDGAGSIFLADDAAGCAAETATAVLSGGAVATVTSSNDGTGTAFFPLQGDTTALTTEYTLCFVADNVTDIDEEGASLNVNYTVDYFNARYDNVDETAGPFGPILRNGCTASIFNIPGSDNARDTAFVRLTNTSDGSTGGVTGTLYRQDGTVVASGFDLQGGGELAPSETGVYHSGNGDIPTAAGRTLFSIPDAAGTPGTTADYLGRGRIVLSGAFPICEALGLVRNAETGALYNMTATTQGNESRVSGTITTSVDTDLDGTDDEVNTSVIGIGNNGNNGN